MALSPDGDHLIILTGATGRVLNIISTESRSLVAKHTLPDGFRSTWVVWATNERILIGGLAGEFSVRRGRITIPTGRTLSVSMDGQDAVVLFENQRNVLRNSWNLANVTDILPEDPEHILMPGVRNGDLDLWKVNILTGDAERVAIGSSSTFNWQVDANGNPAFRYDINRRGTVVRIYAPDGEGRWRRIATVRERDLHEFQPVASTSNRDQAYIIARPEGEDLAGVYIYDFRADAFLEKVASHPRVDIRGVYVTPRTHNYLGYYTHDDGFVFQMADEDMQSHVEGIRDFLGPDFSFSIQGMSDDEQTWLIYATSPNTPGSYYVYYRDLQRMELYWNDFERLANSRLAKAEVVRYSARDGVEITGYLTRPSGVFEGPLPLVLMPHGGPEARDVFDFNMDAQVFATQGYAVFQPNFRGSAGYGRAFAEAGYGEWGGKMQDDLTDAVAHLIETGVTEPGRICIVGGSYGGYAALAGASFTPDLYSCAISINGVADLVDQARYDIREGDDDEDAYVRRSIGDPREDRDRLIARSPARHADRIKIPVLLFHGEDDEVVPVRQSRKMEKALQRAGGDVTLIEFEYEGHSNWSTKNRKTYFRESLAFLEEHLE